MPQIVSHEPAQAFADSEAARSFLHMSGSSGLPLTLVDGVTALIGRFPTRDMLLGWAGTKAAPDRARVDLGLTASGPRGGACWSDTGCC